MESPLFSVIHTSQGLDLVGEFDEATVGELEASLSEHVGETVLLNCAGVTFFDSSALSTILRAITAGVDVRLTAVPAKLRRLLDITGLTELIAD